MKEYFSQHIEEETGSEKWNGLLNSNNLWGSGDSGFKNQKAWPQIPCPIISIKMPVCKDRSHIPLAQNWLYSLQGSVSIFLKFLNFRMRGASNVIYPSRFWTVFTRKLVVHWAFSEATKRGGGLMKGRWGKTSIHEGPLLLGLCIRLFFFKGEVYQRTN